MIKTKTPGVYIQEISTLPASVAPVATAIPGFVGYTKTQGERDGERLEPRTPVRITSLLEFTTIFGGPYSETFDVTISDPSAGSTNPGIVVTISTINTGTASDPEYHSSPYLLYYQLQMYFANGGGPCHVISVGTYNDTLTGSDIKESDLSKGIDACEEVDEITLLVVPEAIKLGDSGRKNINNTILAQCNKLQDRFAIMDAYTSTDPTKTVFEDGDNFRDEVGTNYLKYGAAYYPSLHSTIAYSYDDTDINITDRGSGFFDGATLNEIIEGFGPASAATGTITVDDYEKIRGDKFIINGVEFTMVADEPIPAEADEIEIGRDNSHTAGNIIDAIDPDENGLKIGIKADRIGNSKTIDIEALFIGEYGNAIPLEYIDSGTGVAAALSGPTLTGGEDNMDRALYNLIKQELGKQKLTLYPSAGMAGIYARTDRNRGVWKAPANTSLNLVDEPSKLVTDEEQAALNVDADTGKSINAIRHFHGKGSMVWGARTLAGNDNEWRYVPVRRLFIFIEESIQKATERVVFEPNDANTWSKTKSMIENFLTSLWREGALAGATQKEAFFVKAGLGETMSSTDILEGRMIIDVGIAAVRPAEFIILQFSHKLQEA